MLTVGLSALRAGGKTSERRESKHSPGVEGLSLLSPPEATSALYYRWGFRAQGTEGSPEGFQWGVRGGKKEALGVPSLGS